VSLYRIEKALNQSDQYEKIRQPLLAASEEIKHLTTLAERFSELAKLPPPKIELTDLNNLLTSVVELYREQLDNFDFSLNLPTEIVQARIDPTYFREAVHNLLKNAIDASRPGGKIILSLTLQTQLVNISVRDFGAGMSPETMRSARMPYFTTKDH
jgi:signal transduction histidine kinase